MAVLGSIGVAVYRSDLAASAPAHLPPAALGAARSTLGGALSVASDLPARLGSGLDAAARVAFSHGLDTAALGAAIAMIVAAASCRFFRGIRVVPEDQHDGALPAARRDPAPQAQASR